MHIQQMNIPSSIGSGCKIHRDTGFKIIETNLLTEATLIYQVPFVEQIRWYHYLLKYTFDE